MSVYPALPVTAVIAAAAAAACLVSAEADCQQLHAPCVAVTADSNPVVEVRVIMRLVFWGQLPPQPALHAILNPIILMWQS